MTVGMPEVHQAGVVSARFASGQLCAVRCGRGNGVFDHIAFCSNCDHGVKRTTARRLSILWTVVEVFAS